MTASQQAPAGVETNAGEHEVVYERLIDAPRELVFRAWTEREHLLHWWRPKVFKSVEIEAMDVQPGGVLRIRLRQPDGTEYLSRNVYREIAAPALLVYDEACDENGRLFHKAHMTVSFEAEGGGAKTRLIIRARLELVPGRDPRWSLEAMKQGWTEGWTDNTDLLVAWLSSYQSKSVHEVPKTDAGPASSSAASHREFVTTRLIAAPRELVFEAWTNPKHIALWWGPDGFTNTIHAMEVRPGGVWRFVMHGPDGADFPNRIVYSEVVKPERLAYAHGDDVEGASAMFHVTVTFFAEGGNTRLTMLTVFASQAERDKIMTGGAVEGGKQTLDRLEQHLKTMA